MLVRKDGECRYITILIEDGCCTILILTKVESFIVVAHPDFFRDRDLYSPHRAVRPVILGYLNQCTLDAQIEREVCQVMDVLFCEHGAHPPARWGRIVWEQLHCLTERSHMSSTQIKLF
jgi:hypothetical protein